MRHFLIDYARTKGRQKRGGNRKKCSFEEAVIACQDHRDDLLELNDALDHLSQVDPRKAELVEMKYFGGLSNQEIAAALNISLATVKRDWNVAKAWLLKELREQSAKEGSDSENRRILDEP